MNLKRDPETTMKDHCHHQSSPPFIFPFFVSLGNSNKPSSPLSFCDSLSVHI